MYLASYLGFRPAGENTPPPNSNEANAKQFVEALKKVRDALGHAATKPARTDRGAGRVAVSDALEPKTVVETTGIDEYRHFFDFEAPPKVATRPNPGRPIEMPSSPPPPPKKKRSSFEFDGSPYR